MLRVGDERRRLREDVGDAGRLTTDPAQSSFSTGGSRSGSGKMELREREYKWEDQMNGTVR